MHGRRVARLVMLALALVATFATSAARAAGFEEAIGHLSADANAGNLATAVEAIAASGDPRALRVLEALSDDKIVFDENGAVFIEENKQLSPVLAGHTRTPVGRISRPVVDNRVRRIVAPAVAALRLASPDVDIRRAAAEELAKSPEPSARALIARSLAKETDSEAQNALALAAARLDFAGNDRPRKIAAIGVIGRLGDTSLEDRLLPLADPGNSDAEMRDAARVAAASIHSRAQVHAAIGNLFYGVSLSSVLLLAALGLAITFGLMRVINMAHGEMLMLGAYTTFVVQNAFQRNVPAYLDWYLVAALPAAFAVCLLAGVALERTIVRRLYGRPLETLLATWGVSLVLIQTVRLTFGAANVAVANPSWLSGGFELFPGVVLPYSRIAVIVFVVLVVTFVWLVLQRTAIGLQVRAITQNRDMAAAMGIRTRRVDMWTFGLGSGVAGVGGVALSQLGNVGPELGQAYIVDSFMVVVLGGVGSIAGTIVGALGLGLINKFFEPFSGAVLGKIIILVFVILFIQKRPQGIFALKGRAAEA